MQFAVQEIASNLQNIARAKGTALTKNDLINAVRLANLSVFPGTTQYSQNSNWTGGPLGYISVTRVHYVKGTGPNEAEIKWYCRPHAEGVNNYAAALYTQEMLPIETKIKSWKGAPSDIYSDLRLSENEEKIIVEHNLVTDREDSGILGFYFLDFLKVRTDARLFISSVIFSPVPGAFSETPPQ
mgnify:FL=1